MKKGEVALSHVAPKYAFGSSGSQQEYGAVPPNSTVYYEVELVSFVKDEKSMDMNTLEKIEAACTKKVEGNGVFKAGKCGRASNIHEKASKYIECDISFNKKEKKQSKAFKICCVGVGEHQCEGTVPEGLAYMDLAVVDIRTALEISPNNMK